MIFVDACFGPQSPPRLVTAEFMAALRRRLAPGGVAAVNLAPPAFRLKWMDDTGNLRQIVLVPGLASERTIAVRHSYLLPKKVAAKPAKGTVAVAGVIDTGPDAPDLSGAATLRVGAAELAIPAWTVKGTRFSYRDDGIDLRVALAKSGTSKGKFSLKAAGAAAAAIDPDAPLALGLACGTLESVSRTALQAGKFALGKRPGTLTAPGLYVLAAGAKLAGNGTDALAFKLGFAPPAPFPTSGDLEIRFRGQVVATILLDQLTAKGTVRSYRDARVSLAIDLAKETLALKATGLGLGALPQGAQPVLLSVQLAGGATQAVAVRMVRKGKALKY